MDDTGILDAQTTETSSTGGGGFLGFLTGGANAAGTVLRALSSEDVTRERLRAAQAADSQRSATTQAIVKALPVVAIVIGIAIVAFVLFRRGK